MRILHVASELYPFVKTGGLGDVMAALPPALTASGVETRLLLPGYPALLSNIEEQEVVELAGGGAPAEAKLRLGRVPGSGVLAYLIDAPDLFSRAGNPYLGPDGRDWADNDTRFALLGRMAARLAAGAAGGAWRPDVVQAHDWHAGLAPAYLRASGLADVASVFTIHNLAFQGLFPADRFAGLGLPSSFFSIEGLEYYGGISFMKAGIRFADRITTVSPSYAAEIQTPAFGFGLDGLLRSRSGALSGILNGVDYAIWSPDRDAALPRGFDGSDLTGKAEAKAALQRRLGLAEEPGRLLFGAVTRLTEQKGFDLVLEAVPEIVRRGGQAAVLGSGDEDLEREFQALAARFPGDSAVRLGFDEPLAHGIIGGSDIMLVPSRFEPCGLTQLYAMRYGTLPLVHRVGGLADTVVDVDVDEGGSRQATGIVFDEPTVPALLHGVDRAFACFHDPDAWQRLQRQAMASDFSWASTAGRYIDLYRDAIADRAGGQPPTLG